MRPYVVDWCKQISCTVGLTVVAETDDDWLTDERDVYGMHARQVNTGQWVRVFFSSFTSGVVSSDTGQDSRYASR